jgi:hypothetical protein
MATLFSKPSTIAAVVLVPAALLRIRLLGRILSLLRTTRAVLALLIGLAAAALLTGSRLIRLIRLSRLAACLVAFLALLTRLVPAGLLVLTTLILTRLLLTGRIVLSLLIPTLFLTELFGLSRRAVRILVGRIAFVWHESVLVWRSRICSHSN